MCHPNTLHRLWGWERGREGNIANWHSREWHKRHIFPNFLDLIPLIVGIGLHLFLLCEMRVWKRREPSIYQRWRYIPTDPKQADHLLLRRLWGRSTSGLQRIGAHARKQQPEACFHYLVSVEEKGPKNPSKWRLSWWSACLTFTNAWILSHKLGSW